MKNKTVPNMKIKEKVIDTFKSYAERYLPVDWIVKFENPDFLKQLNLIERQAGLLEDAMDDIPSWDEHILFWDSVSGRKPIYVEAIIALALKLRGVRVSFVICDGVMTGCSKRSVRDSTQQNIKDWIKLCARCFYSGSQILKAFGIPCIKMSELVSEEKRNEFRNICGGLPNNELNSYKYHGLPVGLFAYNSTFRYFRGPIPEKKSTVSREYLFSTLVATEAGIQFMDKFKPDKLFMCFHLSYGEWAPVYHLFARRQLPITLWEHSLWLDGTITLKNVSDVKDEMIFVISDNTWNYRKDKVLKEKEDEAVDWLLKHCMGEKSGVDRNQILQELNISDDKPIWCIFTQLAWDKGSALSLVFEDISSWILDTISFIMNEKDITWLIKIHPRESEQIGTISTYETIKKKFPKLPDHIRIIKSDSGITADDLTLILSGGVTLNGSLAVYYPAKGIPMIVGDSLNSYCHKRGLIHGAETKEEYFEMLTRAKNIPRLSDHEIDLTRRFLFALYYEKVLPLNIKKNMRYGAAVDPDKLPLLLPGRDGIIDLICDNILDGGDFVLEDPLSFGLRKMRYKY